MKNNKKITYSPIGIIHSPHMQAEKTPIQPAYTSSICGKVEIFSEYIEAIKDLDEF